MNKPYAFTKDDDINKEKMRNKSWVQMSLGDLFTQVTKHLKSVVAHNHRQVGSMFPEINDWLIIMDL